MNQPTKLLRQLDKDIASTDKELDALQRYRQGLQVARESVSAVILNGAAEPRVNGQSRASLIKDILATSPEPVSVSEIEMHLKERGVFAEKPNINASLSYLSRKGEAKNPERGRWVAVTEKGNKRAA